MQIFVWLSNREEAGSGALISIAISTLTTGFASTMIAFDKDTNEKSRTSQPMFYGYIPDDNKTRKRCFTLMALTSTLHNLSRSLGCALLVKSGGKTLLMYFVGGELLLYLAFKILKRDFLYWFRVEGTFGVVASFLCRVVVKVIVDFSGCLQFR